MAHPLAVVMRQYGLLETIVSNLRANDLFALALSSKALYKTIITTSSSLENLLGRVKCSGRGVDIRNKCHMKSAFFYSYNCTEHVHCGSDTSHQQIESRPCVSCKITTCNECRIHCVYQSIYEAPGDPDDAAELPNFSGFVLLQSAEQPILSPHHLVSENPSATPRWGNPAEGQNRPYHDQGYLDVPLEMGASAPPECIEDLLDLDLGCHSLISMSGDSRYAAPSPVLSSLYQVTEERKIEVCDSCTGHGATREVLVRQSSGATRLPTNKISGQTVAKPTNTCHCTLRERILDRWLCLKCYLAEESAIKAQARKQKSDSEGFCRCGELARHVLCLWCLGKVSEGKNVQLT